MKFLKMLYNWWVGRVTLSDTYKLGQAEREKEVLGAIIAEQQEAIVELKEEIDILMAKLAEGVFLRGGLTGNIPSPRVPIKESDVVFDFIDRTLMIRNLEGITISTVQNTNSMEPCLDIGHITINSDAPQYMDSIKIGSVITFDAGNGQRIIHQIISKHEYEGETYYRTQGWNLNNPDPYQIYKEQIESVLLFNIPTEKFYSYVPRGGG